MANEKISAMTSITNSGTLQAAVIDPNTPGANLRTTLPGPVAGGLGIGFDTITNPGVTIINNTGTIVQPDTTNEPSLGVSIAAGAMMVTTGTISSPPQVYIAGASLHAVTGGYGRTGSVYVSSGVALNDTGTEALPAYMSLSAAEVKNSGVMYAASVIINAGGIVGATVGSGGDFRLGAGYGPTGPGGFFMAAGNGAAGVRGGNFQIQTGSGGLGHGNLYLSTLGTVDPHILDVAFLGVSNGVTLSAG